MERKMLHYIFIGIIFFIGLLVGVSRNTNTDVENNITDFQSELKKFENDIQIPNNDFKPITPQEDETNSIIVNNQDIKQNIDDNILNKIAKLGGKIIDSTIDFLSKTWKTFIK